MGSDVQICEQHLVQCLRDLGAFSCAKFFERLLPLHVVTDYDSRLQGLHSRSLILESLRSPLLSHRRIVGTVTTCLSICEAGARYAACTIVRSHSSRRHPSILLRIWNLEAASEHEDPLVQPLKVDHRSGQPYNRMGIP